MTSAAGGSSAAAASRGERIYTFPFCFGQRCLRPAREKGFAAGETEQGTAYHFDMCFGFNYDAGFHCNGACSDGRAITRATTRTAIRTAGAKGNSGTGASRATGAAAVAAGPVHRPPAAIHIQLRIG